MKIKMNKDSKIYIAGHNGMVGSAIVRKLKVLGYSNLILAGLNELDLRNQESVMRFFDDKKPEYVFLAAAKVGGILANNTYPAEFIYDNLMIETNTIHAAYLNKVKKLIFLGSSCIYPKMCEQPIQEEYLLNGKLEPTNEAYAIAKIAGLKMCEYYRKQYDCNFISAMPTNLYGINDNFDLDTSHVIPAMIRKFHEAKINNQKSVMIWGTGEPRREFLYVDDLADALIFLMNNYNEAEHINIGTGDDVKIRDLANIIKDVIGFTGDIEYDTTKPDGTPRKLLNVNKLNRLGWKHQTTLENGLTEAYKWYVSKGIGSK